METKKFDFFETISLGLFSSDIKNKRKHTIKVKNELLKDFNQFLEVEDVMFCLEMMDKGYCPNSSQIKTLAQQFNIKMNKKELHNYELIKYANILISNEDMNYSFLFDHIKCGGEYQSNWSKIISKESVHKISLFGLNNLSELKRTYKEGIYQNKYREESLQEYLRDFRIYKKLYKELYSHKLMSGEKFIFFTKQLEEVLNFFKDLGVKDYYGARVYQENIKEFEMARLELKKFISGHNKEMKSSILDKLNSLSDQALDKTIKSLIIEKNYSINQLEEENKKQIKRIEILEKKLQDKEVTEFIEIKVPVILEKYLSIDEEYRTKLKNVEGFNAQQLMTQSLNNIINLLDSKLENKNSDLISELSIENRALKVKI